MSNILEFLKEFADVIFLGAAAYAYLRTINKKIDCIDKSVNNINDKDALKKVLALIGDTLTEKEKEWLKNVNSLGLRELTMVISTYSIQGDKKLKEQILKVVKNVNYLLSENGCNNCENFAKKDGVYVCCKTYKGNN